MTPAPERIHLPTLAPPPARRGVPVVALVAPLGLALVLWFVMSSPYALLFALLGPVIAGGTALESRRSARRARREELVRARRELAQIERTLEMRLSERREALERAAPPTALTLDEGVAGWRLGLGEVASGVELVGGEEVAELAEETTRLRARGAVLRDAPVLVEAAETIEVTGAEPLVRAFARGLVLQAVARCAPGAARVTVPPGESWAAELPARCEVGATWSVVCGERRVLAVQQAATGRSIEVRLGHAGEEPLPAGEALGWRPAYLAAVEAARLAQRLSAAAAERGWRPPGAIPAEVSLEELLAASDAAPTSAAALGRDADGSVHVDLERDGPHALVAGTTGAGKSELLVSWVLALAARRPPAELAFLLIDFKGGSSFAPLAPLPHVAGIVSDLDEATAMRAVESLRAELRRREARLAQHGARDIGELAPGVLPRLVIVVDEFAALVALDPELQAVFADLAARGRSLGLHLVLGTQRPAGVVRDAVLANITVRACLRVLEPGESTAMVGVPDAAAIPGEQRGRGILRDGTGAREVQFARADAGCASRVAERWHGHPVPEARPWLDPLPAEIPLGEVPAAGAGLVVGLVDLPAQQRREPLIVDPWTGGALLVVGATGSGRTEALATVASAAVCAGAELRWVAPDAAELWAALHEPPTARRALVVVDDLDLLLARGDAEQRADIVELLGRVMREGRRTGIAVVASARSAGGALQGAANAFEQRLLLRLPTREEHLLNGGEAREFRPHRRAGSAAWRGDEAQLALTPERPVPWHAPVVDARLDRGAWALVTPRPEQWLARLAEAGVPATALDASGSAAPAGEAAVRVADADGWLLDHLALTHTRRSGRLLLHGCTRAELRTLVRSRGPVPPLGGDEDDAWLVEGAEITRVRVRLGAGGDQASPSGGSSTSSP